ncbi:MAG: MFS transporter, partial [Pseudomonadota bacterium]
MTGQSSGSAQPGLVQKVNARFFYGWIIVGVAAAGVFSSGPGQSHTFSAFIEPISNALDISSAQIATAYGLATLIAAFALPYMGRLVDRYGPRRMMFIIAGAVGLACLFFAASPNFVWLAIGFGLLRFFGQGSLMLVC